VGNAFYFLPFLHIIRAMAKEIAIVQDGDPVLREMAQTVPSKDIVTPKIQTIIANMKVALDSQKDGVAIAAPQIGIPLRIFVVSGRILRELDPEHKVSSHMVFINPNLTKLSKEKDELEEGCLSLRYKYGKIMRSKKATVEALDETGKKIVRGGSGLLAQIFQHETDHLDGILFTDKAYDVVDIPPEKH
jgi:peptide deformylase